MNFLKFLNERHIETDTPILFIKFFSEKQHREDFINGHLFTSPLKYFVENDSERGLGRGDDFEGVLTINNTTLNIQSIEQPNARSITLGKGKINLFSPEMLKLHCFCVTSLFAEDFDVISETKKCVNIRCNIKEEQLQQMGAEFGEHVCLFNCSSFFVLSTITSINLMRKLLISE